ncbi:MAG: EAL domain-containing protein [Kofleriaceae bacterium]
MPALLLDDAVTRLPVVSILIVDDRPENLLALEVSLESLGQRIVKAASGEDALRCVLEETFAVILMDIRMPGLDGFETLKLLRAREKSRHIPIIFLTAHNDQQQSIVSYEHGAVDYLEKPFDPEALRSKVSVFVHLRQNELALQAARDELETRVAERTRELELEIERRKGTELRLIEQAHHDALTGLANRKLLLEHMKHAVARWGRRPQAFAVMMIDLDRFKIINDSLGHLAGDQLLVEVAARLQRCLRSVDTAARLGGDEFAILVDGIDELRDATRTAERIHRALAEPFDLGGREVFVSGSLGIAMMDERYTSGEELLRDADTALYRAKESGRARSQVFDQEMHETVIAQLRSEGELAQAIERDQLRMHYQPIIELATERVVGYEALIRWQHPERGLVGPSRFIPLAEDTGLIRPIGRWVIDRACEQLARTDGVVIGVNVSASQLAEPGFAAYVAHALHTHKLDPRRLELELTETTMLATRNELPELRNLGLSISLDDFGTGYSCLARLQELAVTTLKIDQSFIHGIAESPEIVNAIVVLAHSLGLGVVAEGIETPEQLETVRRLECEYAQGYLLGKPGELA